MDRIIRTALLSVYDKRGISELADFLDSGCVAILATPGTAAAINVKPYSVLGAGYVMNRESLYYTVIKDGREQRFGFGEQGITNIDLVVVNEEPLELWTRRPSGVVMTELGTMNAARKLDLGGNALIMEGSMKYNDRAAVAASPDQYAMIREEISEHGRLLSGTAEHLNRTASFYHSLNLFKRVLNRNGIPRTSVDLEEVMEALIGKKPAIF